MNVQREPGAVTRKDLGIYSLGLLILGCLVLLVWGFTNTRSAPGILRGPAQLPAKPQPTERALPSGDPEPVCGIRAPLSRVHVART